MSNLNNRIAICFFGQPRKYKKILSQWNKLKEELNADIFIHTWYGEDRGKNVTDINELIKDFQPKEIRVSNPHKFINLIPSDSTYETQGYHVMQLSYSTSNSFLALDEYQSFTNTEYDVVIRVRFDLLLSNIDSFIEFVKNIKKDEEKLYVANNHWQGHSVFDDNIMIGDAKKMKDIYIQYFAFTMFYINSNKSIPSGEHNLYRWFNQLNMQSDISRVDTLNFDLVTYNKGDEFILNQNV